MPVSVPKVTFKVEIIAIRPQQVVLWARLYVDGNLVHTSREVYLGVGDYLNLDPSLIFA